MADVRTIGLADGVTAVLRRPFERVETADGVPQVDRDGLVVWSAEVVIAGRVLSRFNVDNDRPETVRLRVLGGQPGVVDGIVRLHEARLSTWYNPRARGSEARSGVTLTAGRVTATEPGAVPVIRGGVPAALPDGESLLLLGLSDDGRTADVMFPAAGAQTVDGLAMIRSGAPVPPLLLGQQVRPVGLRAYFTMPDREDVGQRVKAELLLACAALEAVPSTNGRAKREPVPVAAAPADGES